jgi:hypothetical protein
MALERPAVLRVYVGGIGVGSTEADLLAAFARVGVAVARVELVVNRATGCLRGFAFVAVVLPDGLASAGIDELLGRMRLVVVDDRPVTVQAIARELMPWPVHGPTAPEQAEAESFRSRARDVRRAAAAPQAASRRY